MIQEINNNDHYQYLSESELQVVVKIYNKNILKVRKFNHLDLVEFYYDDRMPKLIDINYLNTFMKNIKTSYREARLKSILEGF